MNNFLKSLFISTLPLLALFLMVISGQHLFQNGFSWQYAGAFLASFPNVLFFALVFINKKPRIN